MFPIPSHWLRPAIAMLNDEFRVHPWWQRVIGVIWSALWRLNWSLKDLCNELDIWLINDVLLLFMNGWGFGWPHHRCTYIGAQWDILNQKCAKIFGNIWGNFQCYLWFFKFKWALQKEKNIKIDQKYLVLAPFRFWIAHSAVLSGPIGFVGDFIRWFPLWHC